MTEKTETMTDQYSTFVQNHVDAITSYTKGEYEEAHNSACDAATNAQEMMQTLAERLLRAELKASEYELDEILVYFMAKEEGSEEEIRRWEADEDMERFDMKAEMTAFMITTEEDGVTEENLADFLIWYYTCRGDCYETGSLYDFIVGLGDFYQRRK